MTTTNWTDRAKAAFSESLPVPPDKTSETSVVSVLSVSSSLDLGGREGVSSVLAGSFLPVPENCPATKLNLSWRWRIIEGDRITEVTVSPPMTLPDTEEQFPGSVIEMDARRPPVVLPADLVQAFGLSLLIGERDRTQIEPMANTDGLAWLLCCALAELVKNPATVIGELSDREACHAAIALLRDLNPPETLRLVLAPFLPAIQEVNGSLEHRAVHAVEVLGLIAADDSIKARYASHEGAR